LQGVDALKMAVELVPMAADSLLVSFLEGRELGQKQVRVSRGGPVRVGECRSIDRGS
jgi:hypothetical protein